MHGGTDVCQQQSSSIDFNYLSVGYDYTIRVFKFGDIEYLTKCYGLSGSSGKTFSSFYFSLSHCFCVCWNCQAIKPTFKAAFFYLWLYVFLVWTSVGRHFCLKCTATASVAKLSPQARPAGEKPQLRTLETLAENFRLFQDAGSIMAKAKLFKNVIAEPIFRIPLDQVCCLSPQ